MTPRHALALAALAGVLGAVLIAWLAIDRRPPEWDYANHLERAVTCHRILAEPGHAKVDEIIAESSFYPPLVTCAAGVLYFALPVTPLAAQSVIWGFLVVGLLAVYGVGRRLVDGPTGLLAAFFFATAPFVVTSLLVFQLDLPLAALVALALYTLVRAEEFSRWDWSLAAGVVLGVGMLTKPPFAAYLAGPVLWAGWLALRAPDRGARIRRFGAALAVGALIALPWYGPRLAALPMQILNRSFKQAAESGHAPAMSVTGLLFYPRQLVPQFGLIAAPFLLWGLLALWRFRRARLLLWSALAPFALFLLIQNKNLRYTLPLLPAAALIAACGVAGLGPRWRRAVIWACVALGVIQVGAAAFAVPRPPTVALFLGPIIEYWPPNGGDWHHREVLEVIRQESGGRPVTVAVVPNDNFFSVSNFRYEVVRDRLPFRMTRGWDEAPLGVDFAIVKTGDQGPDAASARSDRIMAAFNGGDPWLAAAYPVIARFPLPDGAEGMVRARRIEPVRGPTPVQMEAKLLAALNVAVDDYIREPAKLEVMLVVRTDRRDAILAGQISQLVLTADSVLIGEFNRRRAGPPLRVRGVRLRARDVLFNPRRLADTGRFELLDVKSLAVESLVVTEADIREFLRGQRGLANITVSLDDGGARIALALPGPDLMAQLRLTPGSAGSPFTLEADALRYGSLALPRLLVNWIVRNFDPTPRLRRLPVAVTLAPVRMTAGRIEVGSTRAAGEKR
ncbi:MAG TPA: glycosyltransferase family 39 protein [Methylomirabilota bacterium]|nr:glycosyltransferase family 39 protein [Methylomirabilota bacterium]